MLELNPAKTEFIILSPARSVDLLKNYSAEELPSSSRLDLHQKLRCYA